MLLEALAALRAGLCATESRNILVAMPPPSVVTCTSWLLALWVATPSFAALYLTKDLDDLMAVIACAGSRCLEAMTLARASASRLALHIAAVMTLPEESENELKLAAVTCDGIQISRELAP